MWLWEVCRSLHPVFTWSRSVISLFCLDPCVAEFKLFKKKSKNSRQIFFDLWRRWRWFLCVCVWVWLNSAREPASACSPLLSTWFFLLFLFFRTEKDVWGWFETVCPDQRLWLSVLCMEKAKWNSSSQYFTCCYRRCVWMKNRWVDDDVFKRLMFMKKVMLCWTSLQLSLLLFASDCRFKTAADHRSAQRVRSHKRTRRCRVFGSWIEAEMFACCLHKWKHASRKLQSVLFFVFFCCI